MFDHPVFKMSFFFLLIVGSAMLLLHVSGYYDEKADAKTQESSTQKFFKF